jgi:dual specificity phosphatase 12
MHLNLDDSETEKILDHFDRVYEFIKRGSFDNNRILMCSPIGKSRGPSILIAYMIKKYNLSFEEAFEKIKAIKEDIEPNDGFLIKLKAYDKKTNNKIEYQYKCS